MAQFTQAGQCPVEVVLQLLGGKWKPLIMHHLAAGGTRRFGQLRRALPEVTQQMLTTHLRELERDGLVHWQVYAEVPSRVEYSLTDVGRSLAPVVAAMAEWGTGYLRSHHVR